MQYTKVMIDISEKPTVPRSATASGSIHLKPGTLQAVKEGRIKKGDVFATAKVAGLMAAKNTATNLPMCHPIPLEGVNVTLAIKGDTVEVTCSVKANYRTGVEMEALSCVSSALLTVWDMTKYLEKDATGNYPETIIKDIKVDRKVKGIA